MPLLVGQLPVENCCQWSAEKDCHFEEDQKVPSPLLRLSAAQVPEGARGAQRAVWTLPPRPMLAGEAMARQLALGAHEVTREVELSQKGVEAGAQQEQVAGPRAG